MQLEYHKGILFIRMPKVVDRKLSFEINNGLVPKILSQKIKYIVFNLFNCEYIDSYGLDSILNVKCAVRANKGRVCLCEVPKKIKTNIKKTRITEASDELVALDKIGVI